MFGGEHTKATCTAAVRWTALGVGSDRRLSVMPTAPVWAWHTALSLRWTRTKIGLVSGRRGRRTRRLRFGARAHCRFARCPLSLRRNNIYPRRARTRTHLFHARKRHRAALHRPARTTAPLPAARGQHCSVYPTETAFRFPATPAQPLLSPPAYALLPRHTAAARSRRYWDVSIFSVVTYITLERRRSRRVYGRDGQPRHTHTTRTAPR